jgi:hypothetical protein
MGGIPQAMKMEHYADYSAEDTARSESALLTVWAVLQDWTEDLVLVGGLVPRYICRPAAEALQPVTMDVDLAVSLALSNGMYETTKTRLEKAGFDWKESRFVKTIGRTQLYLDFLTDKPGKDAPDSAMVDDIPVSAVYGVDRALTLYREVDVSGRDLYGGDVTEHIKVCEVGPFICLKLQAYHNRAQSKDVFDFVRAVRDYDEGPDAAVAAFRGESVRNLAFERALHTLQERFANATSKGPVQYADFCAGSLMSDSAADTDFLRRQYANEAVDAAQALLSS